MKGAVKERGQEMEGLGTLIWLAVWGAELGWACRVWNLGLRRRYPALFSYLAFSAVHSILSTAVIEVQGWKSGWFWSVTYPALWALMLCLVLESRHAAGTPDRWRNRLFGVLGLGMIWTFTKGASWTPHDQEITIYGVLAVVAIASLIRVRGPLDSRQNQVTVLRLFTSLFLFEVAVLSLPHGSMELTMRYTVLPVFYVGLMMRGAWSFRQESLPCPGPN